jgi:protein-S-isoprenylcysteine O-methyltransferase Ste14
MFVRAVLAFLALPGIVAFLIPLLLIRPVNSDSLRWPAALIVAAGILLLLWCVRDFYVTGKGTLAPWAPPQRLVAVGLYRWSRNPMYVSVTLILLGWAGLFRSWTLLVYALTMAVVFHLRVILFEEPWLDRTHGSAWREYAARVPRWIM